MNDAAARDVAFRPLRAEDFPTLLQWQLAPHVRQWWRRDTTLADIEQRYGPRLDDGHPTRVFVIELDGEPIGIIQAYRHASYPEWDRQVQVPDAAGVDYLIGRPELCGRGLGSLVLRLFAAEVLSMYPEVTCVAAVPQAANRASCRALEKAGFALIASRQLESDDPSDADISAIYVLSRAGA